MNLPKFLFRKNTRAVAQHSEQPDADDAGRSESPFSFVSRPSSSHSTHDLSRISENPSEEGDRAFNDAITLLSRYRDAFHDAAEFQQLEERLTKISSSPPNQPSGKLIKGARKLELARSNSERYRTEATSLLRDIQAMIGNLNATSSGAAVVAAHGPVPLAVRSSSDPLPLGQTEVPLQSGMEYHSSIRRYNFRDARAREQTPGGSALIVESSRVSPIPRPLPVVHEETSESTSRDRHDDPHRPGYYEDRRHRNERDRARDRERERERDKYRERERDRVRRKERASEDLQESRRRPHSGTHWDKDKDKDYDHRYHKYRREPRSSTDETGRATDKERDRYDDRKRNRERDRDREWQRDRDADVYKERYRDGESQQYHHGREGAERDRIRDGDRDRHRDGRQDADRGRVRDGERDRHHDSHRDAYRDRDRERESDRDKDHEHWRDRDWERQRERERERERKHQRNRDEERRREQERERTIIQAMDNAINEEENHRESEGLVEAQEEERELDDGELDAEIPLEQTEELEYIDPGEDANHGKENEGDGQHLEHEGHVEQQLALEYRRQDVKERDRERERRRERRRERDDLDEYRGYRDRHYARYYDDKYGWTSRGLPHDYHYADRYQTHKRSHSHGGYSYGHYDRHRYEDHGRYAKRAQRSDDDRYRDRDKERYDRHYYRDKKTYGLERDINENDRREQQVPPKGNNESRNRGSDEEAILMIPPPGWRAMQRQNQGHRDRAERHPSPSKAAQTQHPTPISPPAPPTLLDYPTSVRSASMAVIVPTAASGKTSGSNLKSMGTSMHMQSGAHWNPEALRNREQAAKVQKLSEAKEPQITEPPIVWNQASLVATAREQQKKHRFRGIPWLPTPGGSRLLEMFSPQAAKGQKQSLPPVGV